ncbi:N-acetyltransferase [Glaciihabitans arcticus]|uniref:N-acetyltransferase n=1 Tax=Glaciihabitans arcticus TaxID=2668039 RepID=A0A4Q9GU82_9MICO|nr:GNAT family N-acetyltransferase [Glaciihabitans arcticus]TBN58275.1 N-acetyltransferase [Glaciihabitans arcticus]
MTHTVVHSPEVNQYQLQIDGERVGLIDYELDGDVIHLTHTEIDKSDRTRGLGSELVRETLDQIRDETSYRLVADCPFVAHFVGENTEYQALLSR